MLFDTQKYKPNANYVVPTTPHNIIQWTKHSNSNCFACSQVEKLKKGGRPKKRKRQGPP